MTPKEIAAQLLRRVRDGKGAECSVAVSESGDNIWLECDFGGAALWIDISDAGRITLQWRHDRTSRPHVVSYKPIAD